MPSSTSSRLLENIELYLTAVGLALIFAVPALLDIGTQAFELAVTAIAVGVVHGLIFWTVRRKQRNVRRELLRRVRLVLSDRVDEKLGRVLANIQPPDRELSAEDRRRLAEVATAVRDVAATIDLISVETLSAWTDPARDLAQR